MLHSEYGLKNAKGSDKAIDAQRGSAAYGSEIEYTQVKTKKELGLIDSEEEKNEDDDEDEEEEFEEEYEEELEEDMDEKVDEKVD